MPLFSKKKKDGMVPKTVPRQRSVSLFQKLERRQKITDQRAEVEPIMEVFNPLLEFKDIPKADLKKYEDVFNIFDGDGDGMLTLEEIKNAMRKIGTVMTHMQFKEIIKELDSDGDKMLDLREFICIFKKIKDGSGSENLNKLVSEIDIKKIGVGGAKNFFEDKAARSIETSLETEIRLEREDAERKRQEEDEKRKKMANKASAFGDVKVLKKGKSDQDVTGKSSKMRIKKLKSKDNMNKQDSKNGDLSRQSSRSSNGNMSRQTSTISEHDSIPE